MAKIDKLHYDGVVAKLSGSHDAVTTTLTLDVALSSAQGAVPTIAADDYLPLSILTADGSKVAEIVHVTAYTSGATTATVERGQESTTAATHADQTLVVHAATADTINDVMYAAGGGKEKVNTNATSGATPDIDISVANVHDLTLTANATPTFSGFTDGVACSFTLVLRQDATGSRTITWPAAVKWHDGVVPPISTAANAVDIFSFISYDGGTTVFGFLSGKGFA